MTTSALAVRKCTPTPGTPYENGRRVHTQENNGREGGWWLGGRDDDPDGDALRRHLLPDLGLPVPSANCLQSDSDEGNHCLSTLHANDFLPSVFDDKGEQQLCDMPDKPCTKNELKRAVSALIALNRAQSESIRTLSHQWAIRQRELGVKISRLQSSLRLHQSLLVKIIDNLRAGRLSPAHWTELQLTLPQALGELDVGRIDSSEGPNGRAARDQEMTWEANDVLSDAPANWTSKLFEWCSKVDSLPVAEVEVSAPLDTSAVEDAPPRSEGKAADVARSSCTTDMEELSNCEGQGLRVHVMGAGGASLSPAAERDAEHFRDFIGNASLRQEAWMETFSSFATTAAPVGALSSTASLKLRLLDEAVTLPATDLLLLVAESLESLEDKDLKAGMRVLCLLERSIATKCSVKPGSLRKGVPIDVCAFEPFCVCVQPNCDETDCSNANANRKVLTIPVCSLQMIKMVRRAPSPCRASLSGSDTATSREAAESRESPVRNSGSRNASSNTSSAVTSTNESTSKSGREQGIDRNGCLSSSTSTDEHEPARSALDGTAEGGGWISAAKRRKIQEGGTDIEESNGVLNPRGQVGQKAPDRYCQEMADQRQRPLRDHHEETYTQLEAKQSESHCEARQREQLPASSNARGKMQPSPRSILSSSRTDSGGSTSASTDRGSAASPLPDARPDDVSIRLASTNISKEGSKTNATSNTASHVKGSTSALTTSSRTAASTPPKLDSCQRTGTATAVRCSGKAAQQQLERMRQHLPRVRAVPPRQIRQQLPAFDCDECAAFFGMVGKDLPSDRCCRHGQQSSAEAAKCNSEREWQQGSASAAGQQRMWSRHRQFAAPPSTPPGYWDL